MAQGIWAPRRDGTGNSVVEHLIATRLSKYICKKTYQFTTVCKDDVHIDTSTSTSARLLVPVNTSLHVLIPMAAVYTDTCTGYLYSKRHANNNNLIYTSYDAHVTSELTSEPHKQKVSIICKFRPQQNSNHLYNFTYNSSCILVILVWIITVVICT